MLVDSLDLLDPLLGFSAFLLCFGAMKLGGKILFPIWYRRWAPEEVVCLGFGLFAMGAGSLRAGRPGRKSIRREPAI